MPRRGALKSCTRVPLMRGSYAGSSLSAERGSGRTSGTFWLAFLRINKVDMGFLRKGRPFLVFCRSTWLSTLGTAVGSVASLIPGGRRPVAAELEGECRSVGVTKEGFFSGCVAGGRCTGERLVLMGAGIGRWRRPVADDDAAGRLLSSLFCVGGEACACLYFCRATPPRKPESMLLKEESKGRCCCCCCCCGGGGGGGGEY